MFYLGIDIAKLNHVASLINNDGKIIFKNFKFKNNFCGFSSLIDKISHLNKNEIIIGFEATGHYSDNFLHFFLKKEFKLAQVNPLLVSNFRKSLSMRDSKNDNIDSITIAKFLIVNNYKLISISDIKSKSLKILNRNRDSLVKQRSKHKILLRRCLDSVFPELQFHFNIHLNCIYALLKLYPSATKIAALKVETLAQILYENSRGRFHFEKANLIKSLAVSSVGFDDISFDIQISQLISSIELFDRQIKEIESKINSIVSEIDSVLLTVPGISKINIAAILGEIGSIDNFKNSSKLLAFAGIDPKVRQSGNYQASSCRMSKRGSRYLRYALILTAWNVVNHNPVFRAYYDLKRSQGKSHINSLGHVAHKLVRVIFKLLKYNISFDAKSLN